MIIATDWLCFDICLLLKWILSSASDDLDVAYQKLSKLIREYLGFSEVTAMSLAPTTGTVLSLLCQNLVCIERKTNLWAVIWGLINQANASSFFFFLKKQIYLYIWLCQILCVARGIFSCGMQTLGCHTWDPVRRPVIKPGPPALGAQSLRQWTTREVL